MLLIIELLASNDLWWYEHGANGELIDPILLQMEKQQSILAPHEIWYFHQPCENSADKHEEIHPHMIN